MVHNPAENVPRQGKGAVRPSSAACALLLVAHAALLAYGAFQHSPGIDEWGTLPAGLLYWTEGRQDVYRVNPPLVRMVAALPVVTAGPEITWTLPETHGTYRPELTGAIHFCLTHGKESFVYFAWARLACIPFSLAGAWFCWRWARELYGPGAGLVALALWCFSPNILAHAQMITPDAAAAALGVAANYAFWRWLRQPLWSASVAAGTALGLALLTKSTWVLLLALWPAMWGLARVARRQWEVIPSESLQIAATLAVGLVVVNACYGFRGFGTRLGRYAFVSSALGGVEPSGTLASAGGSNRTGNRFAGHCLGWIPVPLPSDYVLGIDRQRLDFELGMPSYLRGTWKHGGWWYYYLYAMFVKIPLGTLGLLALGLGGFAFRCGRQIWPSELALLAPAGSVLSLVSSQTGFNHHLRYALPAFGFLFVFAAKPFSSAWLRSRRLGPVACILMAWSLASSLGVYPHCLSYFNELAGGPWRGHEHLIDSNIDWAQDLIYLRRWLEGHPEARLEGIALPLSLPSQLAGVAVPPPPEQPTPGWYAISVTRIHDLSGKYLYFLRFEPVASAGYSIYLYHIGVEEGSRGERLGGDRQHGPAPPVQGATAEREAGS